MRTLNHLQMPAPCSSCGSSAARAASGGASSGAFSAALAQPPGDREGQVISWGPRDHRPSQRPLWEISVVSPRIDTQEKAATKHLVRRNLSWLPPQAYTEDADAPKVLLVFPQQVARAHAAGQAPPLLSLRPHGLRVQATGTPVFPSPEMAPRRRRPQGLGVPRASPWDTFPPPFYLAIERPAP